MDTPELTRFLGQRIRQLRMEKRITLERLAWEAGDEGEDSGLTKGYLSKIEQGEQLPSMDVQRRLAGRLEVEVF